MVTRALCSIVCLSLALPALAQDLSARVRELAQDFKLGSAKIGVSAVDVDTGAVLANVRADERFIPASNMKLLTSGAALIVLGEDYVFRTEFLVDGDRLIVRGGGDPAFADPVILEQMEPSITPEDLVGRIVSAIADSGVERVSEIVLDDRVFDRDRVHEDWPRDQLNRRYCAEVDGITFHNNVLSVFCRPASEGAGYAPTAVFQPEAWWVEIRTKARTVDKGHNTPWMTRDPTVNRFTLHGDVRYPAKSPVHVTLTEPSLFFGRVLADRLKKAGVEVAPSDENPRLGNVRLAGDRDDPDAGTPVAVVTTRMPHVARRCNVDSYNLYAECMIKAIGHKLTGEPGSWLNGGAAMTMLISERLGPTHASATRVADGSGMSRENQVSPGMLVEWLRMMERDDGVSDAFFASLPTIGEGTLRKRFREVPLDNTLHAKSGLLREVRTFSGYLTHDETGRRVAFSILVNDLTGSGSGTDARNFHEAVVAEFDAWLSREAGRVPAKADVGG